MVKPLPLPYRIAVAAAILVGAVLLGALLWTVSHPNDDRGFAVAARVIVDALALITQIALAKPRSPKIEPFSLTAQILGVAWVELSFFLSVLAFRRKMRK